MGLLLLGQACAPGLHRSGAPVTPDRPARPPAAGALAGQTPEGGLRLHDVAGRAELAWRHGAFQTALSEDPVAMMGGGLCWLDFDADGWMDLYVVNSHALAERDGLDRDSFPRNVLYRNRGDGTFEDVSTHSEANLAMRGNGCVAADLDGDGWTDLYVTADGPNALLLNRRDGSFVEVADTLGVTAPEWSTAAVVADVSGDGRMDLFVGAYIDLDRKVPEPLGLFPQDYLGLRNRLFIQQPDGTFRDEAGERGLSTPEERTLGAVWSDINRDGLLDLYVANDGQPNRLYLNGGGGHFRDVTDLAGVGDDGSGMGVAAGDYDGDGWPDQVVSNWDREYNALYRSQGVDENGLPRFEYATFQMGIAGFGRGQTGWGVAWADLDNDTDLDMLMANGHVPMTDLQDDAELIRLYLNQGRGRFLDATASSGLKALGGWNGRGLAVADYDNDGQLEAAIATIAGGLCLLDASGVHGNWLTVSLSTFQPGAVLQAELPDGRVLVREWQVGGSYLSSHDPRFHLGLGSFGRVSRLTVTLPNGETWTLKDLAANQHLRIEG